MTTTNLNPNPNPSKATCQEFLAALYRLADPDSHVCFTLAFTPVHAEARTHSDEGTGSKWEANRLWYTVAEVLAEDFELPISLDDGYHVYLTPHTYLDRSSRRKTNASPTGGAVWLESDDDDLNYYAFDEAYPSAVIETSPGRYHIYFFLEEAAPLSEIERVNKAMAYKYLQRDRSGWDISQLLRVPGYYNHKRYPASFPVSILQRNYAHLVNFATLSHLSPPTNAGSADEPGVRTQTAPPNLASLKNVDAILEAYEDYFTPQFSSYLKTRAPDRSRALWYLYNEAYRLNISPVDAFALIRGSPNNKFADSAYHSEAELWADLNAAYRIVDSGEDLDAKTLIEAARQAKYPSANDRYKAIAQIVRLNMITRGAFYYVVSEKRVVYHFPHQHRLFNVNAYSLDFRAFLNAQYTLNAATTEFEVVCEELRTYGVTNAQHVILHDFCYYDAQTRRLYIADNLGCMYRLDGQTISRLAMGVDGVMFDPNPAASPIYYRVPRGRPPNPGDGLLEKYVLSLANFDSDQLDTRNAQFLLKSWLYSTFFLQESKPLLVVEGPRGSGKSTVFKALEWTLLGTNANVTELPSDAETLKELLRNQHHVFLDGTETISPRQQNVLSTVSTGTVEKKRILYTDNDTATYRLNPAVSITAMSARHLREDLLDRSLILTTQRYSGFLSIDTIKQNVLKYRQELWAQILRELNALVALMADPTVPQQPTTLRMSSYETHLRLMCQLFNRDSKPLISYLSAEQDMHALDDNSVGTLIPAYLAAHPEQYEKPLGVSELREALLAFVNTGSTTASNGAPLPPVPTGASLGHQLRVLHPNLQATRTRVRGLERYTFLPPS